MLHHTPGIDKAIQEIYRVLKPGAPMGVMLYDRDSFLFRYMVQWQEGFVNMESRFLSPLGLGSRYGDGDREEGDPHTWPVTRREARRDLFPQFENLPIKTLGTDIPPILLHWFPGLHEVFPVYLRKPLARRWGWSLWITGAKPGQDAA